MGEESAVGLLTTHHRFEPRGLAERKAEAEVGAGVSVAGGRVQAGLGAGAHHLGVAAPLASGPARPQSPGTA